MAYDILLFVYEFILATWCVKTYTDSFLVQFQRVKKIY